VSKIHKLLFKNHSEHSDEVCELLRPGHMKRNVGQNVESQPFFKNGIERTGQLKKVPQALIGQKGIFKVFDWVNYKSPN